MPKTSPSLPSQSAPLISVIIPVYNVAHYIERCVNSVLAQTYDNLEIILIDDGSTDLGGKFCDVFAKKDPRRVQVIHQENRGLSAARNAGLARATGAYITFIDSDDDVHPEFIARLYALCRDHDADLSICRFRELPMSATPEPDSATKPDPSQAPDTTLTPLDALTTMLCETDFSMSAWGKLYARHLFDRDPFPPTTTETNPAKTSPAANPSNTAPLPIRFPEGMLHEDVGTTYKLVLNSRKIAYTPAALYYYRENPASITQQTFTPRKLDLITLTDTMCDNLATWSRTLPEPDQTHVANLIKKRRMHARFSILRQMVLVSPKTLPREERQTFLATRRDVVRYLRHHKSDVLKNPLASSRDRLAMRSLLLGLPVFKRAWLLYQSRKRKTR